MTYGFFLLLLIEIISTAKVLILYTSWSENMRNTSYIHQSLELLMEKNKEISRGGGGGVQGHAPPKILKVETKICAI